MRIKNELELQDFPEAERITPARGHTFYWFSYAITRLDLLGLLLIVSTMLLVGIAGLIAQLGFTWNALVVSSSALPCLVAWCEGGLDNFGKTGTATRPGTSGDTDTEAATRSS